MKVNYFSTPIIPNDINLIIYHDRCPDGATAAFCAFSILGNTARYLPCSYNNTTSIFENAKNNNLLFLDFSLKKKAFLKLQTLANKVFVLDHHLTAQSELQGLSNVYINLNKCGASLAWEFFNLDKPQPKFIQYVEDVDLWHWKQKDSYYFSLGYYRLLTKNNFDFKIISNVFSDNGVSELISIGQKLYLSFEDHIQAACDHILMIKTKHKGEDINLGLIECQDKGLLNDIALFALKSLNVDGLVLYYKHSSTHHKFSLRRLRDNNKIAMNELAELYSGGGHAHAASFFSDRNPKEVFNSIINAL